MFLLPALVKHVGCCGHCGHLTLTSKAAHKMVLSVAVCRRADHLPVPGVHDLRAEAVPPLGHLQPGLDLRVGGGLHDPAEHQEAGPPPYPRELHGHVQGRDRLPLQVGQ